MCVFIYKLLSHYVDILSVKIVKKWILKPIIPYLQRVLQRSILQRTTRVTCAQNAYIFFIKGMICIDIINVNYHVNRPTYVVYQIVRYYEGLTIVIIFMELRDSLHCLYHKRSIC